MKAKAWCLYKKVVSKELNCVEYIWTNPDGEIIYNRVVCPLGVVYFLPLCNNLTGFRKVKTKMNQEELSKG